MKFSYKSFIKVLLYAYISSKFLYPFCERYFHLPELPPLMLELLFVLAYLVIGSHAIITGKKESTNKYLIIYKSFFSILLLLLIVSSILNNNNWFLVGKSLLTFFFPFIIITLVIIKVDFTEKEQMNLLKFIFFLIILQIPVSVFQYVVFHPVTADSNNGTISNGPLGGTGIIAVLESFLLSYSVANLLYKGFNIKYLLLAILAFVPPVVGGARFGFIVSPVSLVITFFTFLYLYKKVAFKVVVNMSIVSILFLILISVTIIFIIPQTKYARFLDFDVILNAHKAEKYDKADGAESRFGAYPKLLNQYFTNDVNLAIGFGPGAIVQSKSVDKSKATLNFVVNLPDTVIVLASLGVIGIIFILFILLFPIIFIKSYINLEQNLEMHIYACAFVPISVATFMTMFYCETWNTQIGLVYWIMLAIFLTRYKVFSTVKNFSFNEAGKNKINFSKMQVDNY